MAGQPTPEQETSLSIEALGQALTRAFKDLDTTTFGGWNPNKRDEKREMIPTTATLSVTKEEAERQLALYADLSELTEREQKMMAIYDAVVAGDKVILLDDVLERGLTRELTARPTVAIAPVSATEVLYSRSQQPISRKVRRVTDRRFLEFSYTAEGWNLNLEPRRYRSEWDTVTFFEATAKVPSVLPTARDKVEDGDLILWEPVWTDVSQRNEPRSSSRLTYDPAIIRDIGNGLYRVVAAWDLTQVEVMLLGGAE